LGTVASSATGAVVGAAVAPPFGAVPGSMIGALLGPTVADPLIDAATFALQNYITQGTVSPTQQICDCAEVLGVKLVR
ncbi:hypothetical protein BVX97_05485, partial [bacterium E08(2017)]